MTIHHDKEKAQFEIRENSGQTAGVLIYRKTGEGILYATHTKVEPAFEGRGYAGKLVDAISDYAREAGLKVEPVCSYVVRRFRDNPERYADVMAHK